MRNIAITIASFIFLILFIPYLLVSLLKADPFSGGQQATDGTGEAAKEPVSTITTYIADQDEVKEMDFTEYIKGVVAAEMPASFGDEALKAQAVAARSYILTRMQGYERDGTPSEHKGAMTCTDPTHCKAWISKEAAYQNWGDSADTYWEKISSDVEATRGIIMTYEGKPVNAVFHSTSSGQTENSKDVWGGDVPYLQSVASPGDELSPKYESSQQMTVDEFKDKVRSAYPEATWEDGAPLIGDIVRSEAGGISSIVLGGVTLRTTQFRNLFSLPSAHVDFEVTDDTVTMNMKGNGHGVGMSQYGANYLANQGMGYVDILKTYYTGVEVGPWSP